jgi:hypothetical protein
MGDVTWWTINTSAAVTRVESSAISMAILFGYSRWQWSRNQGDTVLGYIVDCFGIIEKLLIVPTPV